MAHAQQLMLRQEEYYSFSNAKPSTDAFLSDISQITLQNSKTNKQTNKHNTPTFSSFIFFPIVSQRYN